MSIQEEKSLKVESKPIDDCICNIKDLDSSFKVEVQSAMDNKTKPVGSLGKLEDIAIKCSLIQQTLKPEISKPWSFVFAADHGIAIEGVSAYPSEVTTLMVRNFLAGGAAINAISNSINAGLSIIDMGVNEDFENEKDLINKKIRKSTSNFSKEKAMTKEEAILSIEAGISSFNKIYNQEKIDAISVGEMGIGNTSSAAAITSVVCKISASDSVGRGTGVDDNGLKNKVEIIDKALKLHAPNSNDAIDILSKIGGFEIGAMAGCILAAASKGVIVVIDGYISTSAALLAHIICPLITNYTIAGHKSVERGHIEALKQLKLTHTLDLNMRLGEGTGAALTISIAKMACAIMKDMASFEDAGITKEE